MIQLIRLAIKLTMNVFKIWNHLLIDIGQTVEDPSVMMKLMITIICQTTPVHLHPPT